MGESIVRNCVESVFKRFDYRGNGLYSRTEWIRLLCALDTQSRLTSASLYCMLEAIDTEDKGWIHYKTFCAWVFSSTVAPDKPVNTSVLLEPRMLLSDRSVVSNPQAAIRSSVELTQELGGSAAQACCSSQGPRISNRTLRLGDDCESPTSMSDFLPMPDLGDSSPTSESLPLPSLNGSNAPTPRAFANLRAELEIAGGVSDYSGEVTRKAEASDEEAVSFFAQQVTGYESGNFDCSINAVRTLATLEQDALRIWTQAPPPWGMASDGVVAVVSCAEDKNADHRTYMEDGHKIVDPLAMPGNGQDDRWGFYAVYDGHGGRDVVEYCESTLHDIILVECRNLCAQSWQQEDVHRALEASFRKIDSQLAMMGAWKSGCTATVALVHRCGSSLFLYVANVGDSRAVLLGGSGPIRMSRDHKASDPEEIERISQEGGIVRHGRVGGVLCVSRSLGDHHVKSCGVSCVPEVHSVELGTTAGALVVASDGLWDTLEDADVGRIVADHILCTTSQHEEGKAVAAHLKDSMAAELVQNAKARGSRDNILALVIFF